MLYKSKIYGRKKGRGRRTYKKQKGRNEGERTKAIQIRAEGKKKYQERKSTRRERGWE